MLAHKTVYVMTTIIPKGNIMFYTILILSLIALPLSKYLGSLPAFQTKNQADAVYEAWAARKNNRTSNH